MHLGNPGCRSLLVYCAHGTIANEAEVLRVAGCQLAVGRVKSTGHHIPIPPKALAVDVSELCMGPLVPSQRCQLQQPSAQNEYIQSQHCCDTIGQVVSSLTKAIQAILWSAKQAFK